MTWGQWIFEYKMLKEQERQQIEFASTVTVASTKALRETLVGVLGLSALKHDPNAPKPKEDEELPEYDGTPFIPAVFAGFANPEVVKFCLDEKEKEVHTDAAAKDAAFDEFSENLMRHLTGQSDSDAGLGDMEPLIDALDSDRYDKNAVWNSLEMQEQLRALNIGIRKDGPAVPHVNASIKGISDGDGGSMMAADSAKEAAEHYEREMRKFKRELARDAKK